MENFFYRVGKNESIFAIAEKFSVNAFDLISYNNLSSEIEEGEIIFVKKSSNFNTYNVRPEDTFKSIAEKFCLSEQSLKEKNSSIPYLFYGMKINI